MHLIRIEYSGKKILDRINKSINSNLFNSVLTLFIIFVLIKYIPPTLNWFIFDADFAGSTKQDCTSDGACWVFVKVWLKRFMYGMYPDAEQWRINVAFIILLASFGFIFLLPQKFKKYIIIYLLFIYPIIALNLISGGVFGLEWVETGAWGGLSLTLIVSAFAFIFCIRKT